MLCYSYIAYLVFDVRISLARVIRGSYCTGCPKKIVPFSKILLFGGRHLENFVPMGTAGISIKTRSI